MTSAPSTTATLAAERVPTAGAGRPVEFVTAMDPPELAEHLFGRGCAALAVEGARSLNARPFTAFDDEESRAALARAQVIVTGWGAPRLSDADLDAAPHLRFVLHAGGQGSGLLPLSAKDRGIQVSNAGWMNAIPVAEYTVAMIVLANKQAFRARRLYRQRRDRVDRELEFPEAGNVGRVIGIVGASRIGRLVVERLADFDVDVQVFDPYLDDAEAARLGVRSVSLQQLMSTSDVVTLHPPLTPATTRMITAAHLRMLHDGATLINTSRGLVVDQDALLAELRTGRIEAVLDTTEPEVLPADDELYTLPNVFLTPHIAGSMGFEIRRLGQHVAGELERIVQGRPLAFPEDLA